MSKVSNVPARTETQHQDKKIVEIIDHNNIDDFFREPSPHELAVTSEMRIAEIIEDLQRRTAEEIKNWTSNQDVAAEPLKRCDASSNTSFSEAETPTKTLFHEGEMVCSPISLFLSSSSGAVPNIASGSAASVRRPRRAGQTPSDTQQRGIHEQTRPANHTAPKDSLALPNKPSFQSFLKRVAKTPPPPSHPTTRPRTAPPPPIVRDFAFPSPRTTLNSPVQGPVAPKALAVLGVLETPTRLRAAQSSDSLIEASVPSSLSTNTIAAAVSLSVAMSPKTQALPELDDASPKITVERSMTTRKTRPRSMSSPILPTALNVKHAAPPKRKPLPQDSPLLVPLAQHPAYTSEKAIARSMSGGAKGHSDKTKPIFAEA